VIGAGPAGLETARVAALRGHHVYLADRQRQIGGTPALLAGDPNRRNLGDHAAFFEPQLTRLGVEMMLGNEVTAEEMLAFAPDVAVIATGGRPLVPDVPGIESPNVRGALDVLTGTPVAGAALVVAGFDKHLAGPTIAEFLADQGCTVEIISEQFDFAAGVEDGTRFMVMQRLLKKGVTVSLLHRLVNVDAGGAVVSGTFSGQERRLDRVTVVLACGLVPDASLASALDGRLPEVHVIGDALAPRRIMHATLEGARVARAI
jgi:pyruvate/2-oxoglutarate dehydrogenase complex dihydrolipoamide dehydrogenase (E3) component